MSPALLVTRQHVIRVPVLIGSYVNYQALRLRLIESLGLHFDGLILVRHSFNLDLHFSRGFPKSLLRRLFLVVFNF